MAAFDAFLKIEGIPGESTDDKHKGELDIESFSWGLSNSGSATRGGGGGRASFQEFNFVAVVSKASPKLFQACASGDLVPAATLTCRKSGRDQQEFLTVKMTDCLISSYQVGGAEANETVPTEQASMNFAKIVFEYKPQKADGSLDAPVSGGWDVAKNVKL